MSAWDAHARWLEDEATDEHVDEYRETVEWGLRRVAVLSRQEEEK